MTDGWPNKLWKIFGDDDQIKGVYAKSKKALRTISEESSLFGESKTVQRTPIIELNSSYGTSALRDITQTTGSGSITLADGEIVMQTGATSGSKAYLDSAEIGRYIPGYGAEIGIGFRLDSIPSGTKDIMWGGQDSEEANGFFFGHDSTGLYVALERNNSFTKVYQSSWNIDKLDGNGQSGVTIDPTKGNIYQIEFSWYGYGQIVFGIVGVINNRQTVIPCHQISNFSTTSVLSPNLRVHAQLNNNDDSENLKAYVGGRQYSIVGIYVPKYRFTGQWRASVNTSTTVIPLISFRRKTDFNDRSIRIQGYDSIVGTEPCVLEIRIGSTLTNASFVNPTNYTAAETALETDISATAVTAGNVVWTQLLEAGSNKNNENLTANNVEFDIPNGQILTMCVRTVTGTGTITSALRMREEW